ncbi:MAG: hypothetical protein ACRCV9_09545 [Burkholderiaceae bacterium]
MNSAQAFAIGVRWHMGAQEWDPALPTIITGVHAVQDQERLQLADDMRKGFEHARNRCAIGKPLPLTYTAAQAARDYSCETLS